MKPDTFVRTLLLVIAVLLGVLVLRPLAQQKAQAQALQNYNLYIEPGTTMVRSPDATLQVQGKVVVDLRNGKAWGFPTLGSQPYPMDTTRPEPPVSHPIYLGQFDFAAMNR
jgi:hypothetical protein